MGAGGRGSRLWEWGWSEELGRNTGPTWRGPWGEVDEELRPEHRTGVCSGPPGLGTETLNSRQASSDLHPAPSRTQLFIHSFIYFFIPSLHPLFSPGVQSLSV